MFDWRPPTLIPSSMLIQTTPSIRSFIRDLDGDALNLISGAASSLSRAPLPLENETIAESSLIKNHATASISVDQSTRSLASAWRKVLMLPGLSPLRRHTLDSQNFSGEIPLLYGSSDRPILVQSPISKIASMSTPALLPSHREPESIA